MEANLQRPEFHVGTKVWYIDDQSNRYGPYLVATAPSAGKCTLCELNGAPALNSVPIAVSSLEMA